MGWDQDSSRLRAHPLPLPLQRKSSGKFRFGRLTNHRQFIVDMKDTVFFCRQFLATFLPNPLTFQLLVNISNLLYKLTFEPREIVPCFLLLPAPGSRVFEFPVSGFIRIWSGSGNNSGGSVPCFLWRSRISSPSIFVAIISHWSLV